MVRARIGTIAWDKPYWKGHFYPPGLPQGERLRYASERLSTIEINATFHMHPRPEDFRKWRDVVPEDFVFSVKGNQEVTHTPAPGAGDRALRFLSGGVLELQDKLSVVLWQLPPRMEFRPQELEGFLEALPHSLDEARHRFRRVELPLSESLLREANAPIRHALEVRHHSFADERFFDLLRRHEVATVRTNTPPWPVIDELTADFVYLRLHGNVERFPEGYGVAGLERMATSIRGWLDGTGARDGRPRDVFVYFDNPDHGGTTSPFDAIELQRLVGGGPPAEDATLQIPLWD